MPEYIRNRRSLSKLIDYKKHSFFYYLYNFHSSYFEFWGILVIEYVLYIIIIRIIHDDWPAAQNRSDYDVAQRIAAVLS